MPVKKSNQVMLKHSNGKQIGFFAQNLTILFFFIFPFAFIFQKIYSSK